MPTDQHAPAGPLLLDVDDTAANRYWRSRVLRRAGFEVIEAATGEEASGSSDARRPPSCCSTSTCQTSTGSRCAVASRRAAAGADGAARLGPVHRHRVARVAGPRRRRRRYLLAPSEPAELLAQVRALLRLHAAEEAARRAEEATRESEARFRTLADNIAQFAWMADERGWIFWYNRRWFDYTGTTLEEMQGWGWTAVHHPDHLERVAQKFAQHIDSGEAWEDTFPLRGRDGQYRWFLSRAMPIRDADGRVLRWFGTNTDVTDQKRAEEQVRVTLESIGDGFFAVDEGWRFTYVNAAAERLLGVPRDQLIGHPLWEAFALARGTLLEQEYRRRSGRGRRLRVPVRALEAVVQQPLLPAGGGRHLRVLPRHHRAQARRDRARGDARRERTALR
jgi:PAS domain S-box-containing protein